MEPLHPIKMHLIRQAFIMSDLEFTKPQLLHLYNKNNVPRPCEEDMKCPHFLPLSQLRAALVYIVHTLFSHRQELPPRDGSSHALEYTLSIWWVHEVTLGSQSGYGFHCTDAGLCSGLGPSFPSNSALWNVSSDSFEICEQNNEHCLTWFSQHPASVLWEHPVCWWTEHARQTHCLQVLPFKGNISPGPFVPTLPMSIAHGFLGWQMCLITITCFSGQAFEAGCHPMLG